LTSEPLLETEKLLNSLANELVKLKTAVGQYEETRNDLSKVKDSVEQISTASMAIAENGKGLLTKLEQMSLEQKLKQLDEGNAELSNEQKRHTQSLNLIESRLKQNIESLTRNFSSQSKLLKIMIGLLLAVLAVGVADMVLLLIRN